MPWCEPCARYYHAPSALDSEGRCPACGSDLSEQTERTRHALAEETTPWHFKLLVVALVVYLGWRFVELFA